MAQLSKKESWGQLATKFSFLVARTSFLVAKNYLQEKKESNYKLTKGLFINLNKIVNKLQKVNPEYKRRPSTKQTM